MLLYDKVASILESSIVYPDLIIFLQSDTDRLMSNIISRGRNYELNIDWKYIDALNQIYNEYFFMYDKYAKFLDVIWNCCTTPLIVFSLSINFILSINLLCVLSLDFDLFSGLKDTCQRIFIFFFIFRIYNFK